MKRIVLTEDLEVYANENMVHIRTTRGPLHHHVSLPTTQMQLIVDAWKESKDGADPS
jgi:hypothetical protein